ncbi:MAG: translation initiation factor IF-3 [Elusimicrobiales bacterium]|nr:translation initiation factor IF-3 [Elusimicrobiales bacterium]
MKNRNFTHTRRTRVNKYINAANVRLIGADGVMMGVKSNYEALNLAKDAGLDLVEIVPQSDPPVCKIMDFSKYLYDKGKQKRDNKKKQRVGILKEIRLHPRIAEHDLNTKVKHVEKFLKAQNKVRVTVVFHGRENQHRDLGMDILENIKESLREVGTVDGKTNYVGNRISLIFTPKLQ